MEDPIEALQDAYHGVAQVSPLAFVARWARLGSGCVVHPFAVVGHQPSRSLALARQPAGGAELEVGANTVISPHAVIYARVRIGKNCLIGDGASIREGTVIGDRCVIGRCATVMHDVVLGDDVRVHDGCHLTGHCRIGAGSFLGPGVVTCNDRLVDLENYQHRGALPVVIGKRVLIGAGATLLAGVVVGDGAVVGIGAVVVEEVLPGNRVLGHKATAR